MTRKPVKRAAGYIRISALMGREQGGDLLSDVIQREKIEAWASYRGFRVAGWYVDLDVSGREGVRRPEFERMMNDAAAGKFDAVAVYRLTRFARSVRQAAEAYAQLREVGVELVSCTEDIDTTNASGKFMQNIMFSMAEFESERISEEWKNVHAIRRSRGEAHVATGLYGFDTAKETSEGAKVKGARIVGINPDEAAAVRLSFEMYADGLGPAVIRDRLHDEGFRPARGGEWFAQSTLTQMLRNPTYAGLLRMPDGELQRAAHDPIVSLDLWERVQTRSKRPVRTRRAKDGTSFLVGLVFCAGCGLRMKFQRRGDRPPVFRCFARQRSKSCPTPGQSILARRLEEYVVEQLLLDRASFERRRTDAASRDAAASQRLRARDADVARMIERLTGRIARSDDEALVTEYEREIGGLLVERSAIAELLAEIGPLPGERRMPSREGWEALQLDEQRVVIAGLVRRLIVSKSEVRGGSHKRGIDFEQRVRIELSLFDDSANPAAGAIGRMLAENVDLEAPDAVLVNEAGETFLRSRDAGFSEVWNRSSYCDEPDDPAAARQRVAALLAELEATPEP